VLIRPAAGGDAGAIAALLRGLGWFRHLNEEPHEATERRVAAHLALCAADRSHAVFVAEANGVVVGYAAVHWLPYLFLPGPEGYVSELFVRADARGRGVGRRLLDRLVAEARSRGCSRLMLVNNRERESYRRGFYRKQGWREREGIANFVLEL